MQNIKAKAVHDLICEMLRGPHIRTMAGGDLPGYLYKAGVALHNLPFAITGEQPLIEGHFCKIGFQPGPVLALDELGHGNRPSVYVGVARAESGMLEQSVEAGKAVCVALRIHPNILTLVGVLENIPEDVLQASSSLGASPGFFLFSVFTTEVMVPPSACQMQTGYSTKPPKLEA